MTAVRSPRSLPAAVQRIGSLRFLLGAFVLILAVEGIVAIIAHRQRGEWKRLMRDGAVEEKILALQVLSNRFDGAGIDAGLVGTLLASDDRRLHEVTMTSTITRLAEPVLQRRFLAATADTTDRIVGGFLLDFQAGSGRKMELEDLRRALEAMDGEDPDSR